MSRIGKQAINLPAGVKVAVVDGVVTVEGKAKLSLNLPPHVELSIEDNKVTVAATDDSRRAKAMWGLARSLVNNMVIGVVSGFKKELQIVGVGYRAQLTGSKLVLNIGYSHPVEFDVPQGVTVNVVVTQKSWWKAQISS